MDKELLWVSNIQRFSVDDGPGIRTTVFLKGCNLRCAWCHNPENIVSGPQLQWKKDFCLHCGRCVEICQQSVHEEHLDERGKIVHKMHFSYCLQCGECVKKCLGNALSIIGEKRCTEEIISLLMRDKDYYDRSGGGVTFSGGEPLLQHKKLAKILEKCKSQNLQTAVDTAGDVPYEWYEEILPYTDLFLYDLKCVTKEIHTRYVGNDNQRIQENIRKLSQRGARIIVRVPLIDPVNTGEEEAEKMAVFLGEISNIELCQLLPYHDYGLGKYEMLGYKNMQENFSTPNEQKMQKIFEIFRKNGVNVEIS